jgi:hypothetical protein
MAETMGSLMDKICIAELKIFHILEQIDRTDLAEELRQLSRDRLSVMRRQRDDLSEELNALADAWARNKYRPKVYRQFKMYNDLRFQKPHPGASPVPLPDGRGRRKAG